MVEQIAYQTLFQFLQTVGILVGVFYYIMTIRANQRNQEIALKNQELTLESQQQATETRQAQLFMQIYNTWSSRETIDIRKELQLWEWTDYDDFIRKYGADSNPEAWASFQELGNFYEGIGVLIKRQLIDPTFVDDLMSGATLWGWEKFGGLVREYRIRENVPFLYEFWEYLYNAVSAIAHEQHPELRT